MAAGLAVLISGGVAWGGLNPARPGLPRVSAYGTTYDGNVASALCVDCHTGSPKQGAGSHFVSHWNGLTVLSTSVTAWEKLTAWAGTGGLSRYASPPPPNPLAVSVTGAVGEMICESCHDLRRNADGGNNLVEGYRDAVDPTSLCVGCHAAQAAGPPAHHPLTAHIPGGAQPAGVRYPPAVGSEVPDLGAWNRVTCASCHSVHGGPRAVGARVLRRGLSAVATTEWSGGGALVSGKSVNVLYYAGKPEAGDTRGEVKDWCTDHPAMGCAQPGLLRQQEVSALNPAWRLVINADPLCDACHVY